jgi:parallel beta-helix repeat protein
VRLTWLVLCLLLISILPAEATMKLFYVAPGGNDSWCGSRAQPFRTLEAARDAIRALKRSGRLPRGGVTVYLSSGRYQLSKLFALTRDDSGEPGAPIVYRALPGADVRLNGGVNVTGFRPVTDSNTLERLDQSARGHVLQADLEELGVKDFGEMGEPDRRLELFFNDRPMTLARWPNEGFTHIADLVPTQPVTIHDLPGDKAGNLVYEGDRPSRWSKEKEIWLHGYWFFDWWDVLQKVGSIDTEKRVIHLLPPYDEFGYRKGQRFYALNLLCELDSPGEYYLDRDSKMLYFWPPEPVAQGHPTISYLSGLVSMDHASEVTFQGITFENCRGTAVTIKGGKRDRVAGCVIRNIGSWGVRLDGGEEHAVVSCDLYGLGEGGVQMDGGDRKTLTPGRHSAENCRFHDFGRLKRTYRPAVSISGVGNRVAHNLIYDAPHNVIQLSGNDHVIEYNSIHDVCYETGDVSAFYMGRDWSARGNVIRYNLFHNIFGPGLWGAAAIYLDDAASGTTIIGNIVYKAYLGVLIGGGRDNLAENNFLIDCDRAVNIDARGLTWMSPDRRRTEGDYSEADEMTPNLRAVPYQSDMWRKRYPRLANILDDEPWAPKGNVVRHNVMWRWKEWLHSDDEIAPKYYQIEDNLTDADPGFVDLAKLDFRLRPDSAALKLGIRQIPVDRIGLYKAALRDALPPTASAR